MKRRNYTVRLLRAAEDDFTEIVTYIAAQRPTPPKLSRRGSRRVLGFWL